MAPATNYFQAGCSRYDRRKRTNDTEDPHGNSIRLDFRLGPVNRCIDFDWERANNLKDLVISLDIMLLVSYPDQCLVRIHTDNVQVTSETDLKSEINVLLLFLVSIEPLSF